MNDPDLCLEVVQGHVNHAVSILPKLLELETSNLVAALYKECRADAQIIFLKSGRGLASRHVLRGNTSEFLDETDPFLLMYDTLV